MKYLNKKSFEATLRHRFPDHGGGWLCNCLEEVFRCDSYTISSRAKLDTLIAKTQRIASALGSRYPLIAFPNGCAGWRAVPKNRRQSPIELSSPDDISELIRRHIYFRDPDRYEDNYHIADSSFRWIAVFCHHGDWHFFASPASIATAKSA